MQSHLNEKQAAEYLNVSPRTLQKWRYVGGGPQYVRISRMAIRYRREDLDAWVSARLVSNTSQVSAAEAAE